MIRFQTIRHALLSPLVLLAVVALSPLTAHALSVTNAPQTISILVSSSSTNNIAISGVAYELSSATAVDVNTTSSNNANPLVISFTTTAANEVAIIANAASNSVITYSQNNGWTQDETSANTAVFNFSNILASSGANSLNATPSTPVHNAWAVLSFRGSSTPAAPSKFPFFGVGSILPFAPLSWAIRRRQALAKERNT
jgi:hypothetical protein